MQYFCPLCLSSVDKWLPLGISNRAGKCPTCFSYERHRFTGLFLNYRIDLIQKGTKVLHFSQESSLEAKFRSIVGDDNYISADIKHGRSMVQEDMSSLSFKTGSFDFVYCSHVLPHVKDHRSATKEVCRVLTPFGKYLTLTPYEGEVTVEFSDVEKKYSRYRTYGKRDFVEQLKESGFRSVEIIEPELLIKYPSDLVKYGLNKIDRLFLATK